MSEDECSKVERLVDTIRVGHQRFRQWPAAKWVEGEVGTEFEDLLARAGGDRVCMHDSHRLALTVRAVWEATSAHEERECLQDWLDDLRRILIEHPDKRDCPILIHLADSTKRPARALVHDAVRDTELPQDSGSFQIPTYFQTTHPPAQFEDYLRTFSPAVTNRLSIHPRQLADAMEDLLPTEAVATLGRRRAAWVLTEAGNQLTQHRERLQQAILLPDQGRPGYVVVRATVTDLVRILRGRKALAGGDVAVSVTGGKLHRRSDTPSADGVRSKADSDKGLLQQNSFEQLARNWRITFHGASCTVTGTVGVRLLVLLIENPNSRMEAIELRRQVGRSTDRVKNPDGHRARVSTELGKAKQILRKRGLRELAAYLADTIETRGGFAYCGTERFQVLRAQKSPGRR